MASIDPWINYPVVNRFLMHIDIWKGPTCSSKLLGVEVKNLGFFFLHSFGRWVNNKENQWIGIYAPHALLRVW